MDWGKILGVAGGLVKKGVDAAKKHPEAVVAGVGAVNAARQGAQGNQRVNAGLGQLQGSYDERAPLRAMAVDQLTRAAQPRDLSSLFAAGKSNPFAR